MDGAMSFAALNAKLRAGRKLGACAHCEMPATPGRRQCEEHLRYGRQYHRERRAERRAAGLCGNCGTRPTKAFLCRPCATKHRVRHAAWLIEHVRKAQARRKKDRDYDARLPRRWRMPSMSPPVWRQGPLPGAHEGGDSDSAMERLLERRSEGLCSAAVSLARASRSARFCQKQRRKIGRRQRAKRKKLGLCLWCNARRIKGGTLCAKHQRRYAETKQRLKKPGRRRSPKGGRMMADALPTMTMTCTMASHDEIRADDPRWDAETIGAERWDTGEEILALANCRHCGSTLARVAWRHAWGEEGRTMDSDDKTLVLHRSGEVTQATLQPAACNSPPPRQDVLKRTVARGAQRRRIPLFMGTARRLGLDPFARQIYSIRRWNPASKQFENATQVAIDGTAASRRRLATIDLAPSRGMPMTARVTWSPRPRRCSDGTMWTASGTRPRRRHSTRVRADVWQDDERRITSMWQKMPRNQLAKCAEALALRRAFPQRPVGTYIHEEDAPRPEEIEDAVMEEQPKPTGAAPACPAATPPGRAQAPGADLATSVQQSAATDQAGSAQVARQLAASEPCRHRTWSITPGAWSAAAPPQCRRGRCAWLWRPADRRRGLAPETSGPTNLSGSRTQRRSATMPCGARTVQTRPGVSVQVLWRHGSDACELPCDLR